MNPGISAIVIVHNQVDLLKKCLDSIYSWIDEIILVDLESTDDIKSLAPQYQAKYVAHKQVAIVEEVRQESLKLAHHEYVLFLDPDETISENLAKTIQEKIESKPTYIKIPRQNYIFGKWIEHSLWWPDYQVRLFKKNVITWPTSLHAQPEISGEGVILQATPNNAITHLNYVSLDEWFDKNKRYAKTKAKEITKSGEELTLAKTIKSSVGEIMQRFFQAQGYKDGMHGLVLSILQSYYHFQIYAYYWEATKYKDLETESSIKSFPRTWFSHGLSEVIHWDKAKSFTKVIKEKFVRRMIA